MLIQQKIETSFFLVTIGQELQALCKKNEL